MPRDCHQTQSWQTEGADRTVARVSPETPDGIRRLMPRSRASGCAVWRVWAASRLVPPAERAPQACALRVPSTSPMPLASPRHSAHAPERPAHAPAPTISWHQPSQLPGAATPAITTSTLARNLRRATNVLGDAALHDGSDLGGARAPADGDVDLDRERPLVLGDPHASMSSGAVDESRDAVDLACGVCRIGGEDVVRDDRVLHHAQLRWSIRRLTTGRQMPDRTSSTACRSTSSVTSGRAKNRNGTNVVPVPGETCIVPAGVRYSPRRSGLGGGQA